MPKPKDYIPMASQLWNYFSKNAGMNTITAAVAPLAITGAVQNQETVAFAADVAGTEVAAAIALGTPVGYAVAGLIIVLRIGLAIFRKKKA